MCKWLSLVASRCNEESKKMRKVDMQIGKYRLLNRLHGGRYIDVWLAEHLGLKKKVAIKILLTQEISDSDEHLYAKKRFYREAQALARLDHPHIVQAFDSGEEAGRPFFIMEYAPYGSLARRHPLGERLPLPVIRTYISQVGRAINYIHSQGLIHRDIKPQNMFLRTRSMVLLGDFGLVMHARNRLYSYMIWEFGGTTAYMAPEQEIGEPCQASDQYAFATVVFEWLTGCSPFYGTAEEIAWQRKHLSPPSMRTIVPEIPAAVERVVLTALQKMANHRFRTMLDFTLAFEEACRPAIVRLPYNTPVSRSHRVVASHHHKYTSRYGAALRQQQPVPAAQGVVLVAPSPARPVPLRHRQVQEEPWDPVASSDGDEKKVVLFSRLQVVWRIVCDAWQRIAGFLERNLGKY